MRKPSALLPLLLLWACNNQPTPTNSLSAAPPPPAPVSAAPPAAAVPANDTSAAYTGLVWRDRLNGNTYPLPDSIGGRPVSFYLSNPQVSPLAKALYTGRFRPTDTDSTTQLLALAATSNKALRPFYRWCLDFTIVISDGALGEYTGEPALAYATKFSEEFFAYMDKDKTGQRYNRWVESIAYSGLSNYQSSAAETQKTIAATMNKQCLSCAAQTVSRINTFAKDVASFASNNN